MKALSIRQPWAWAILNTGKRIENRTWHCRYRGPILIHAAKGGTMREWQCDFDEIVRIARSTGVPIPGPVTLRDLKAQSGGIVGRARIVDCICPSDEYRNPWYVGDFGLVLADVTPLPFVPWTGSLGLFEVPDSILEARP